jgi:hypothetical protein
MFRSGFPYRQTSAHGKRLARESSKDGPSPVSIDLLAFQSALHHLQLCPTDVTLTPTAPVSFYKKRLRDEASTSADQQSENALLYPL